MQIIDAIVSNQVVLIAGETGCGKTTQVPQFLLEHAWGSGQPLNVLCSQPRRLATVSVSTRIAAERGEEIGGSIGYRMRLDSQMSNRTSLSFVTTGILVKMLTDPQGVGNVTHIIVDEVHERDQFTDFALILLRKLLPARPDLRVVLMSATLQSDLFSAYFGGCPVLAVPGFTYPVQEFFLEDALLMLSGEQPVRPSLRCLCSAMLCAAVIRSVVPPELSADACGGAQVSQHTQHVRPPQDLDGETAAEVHAAIFDAFSSDTDDAFSALLAILQPESGESGSRLDIAHPETGATALMVAAGRGRMDVVETLLTLGANPLCTSNHGLTAAQWALQLGAGDVAAVLEEHVVADQYLVGQASAAEKLKEYYGQAPQSSVDHRLVVRVLQFVCHEFSGPVRPLPWHVAVRVTARLTMMFPVFCANLLTVVRHHCEAAAGRSHPCLSARLG